MTKFLNRSTIVYYRPLFSMADNATGEKRPLEPEDSPKEKRESIKCNEDGGGPTFVSRIFANFGNIRRYYSTGERADKEYWMKLSLEEKRKQYRCGKGYLTLNDIKKWPEFYKHNTIKPCARPNRYSVNEILNDKVSIYQGDITKLEVDSIVNAANSSLMGGGGVDGAIHSAAGYSLRDECYDLGGCDTGQTKMTTGHRLPAKHILHTVGPINGSVPLLKSCYYTCFDLVKHHQLKSVAFCCIATGVYGFPNDEAANIALDVTRQWLETDDNYKNIDRIIFVVFLKTDYKLYTKLMQEYFPLEDNDVGEVTTPPRDDDTHPRDEESEDEDMSTFKVPSLHKSVTAPAHVVHTNEKETKKDKAIEEKDKMVDKDTVCNVMEVSKDDEKKTVAKETVAMETDKEIIDTENESNVINKDETCTTGSTGSV